jgi:protoporphyrinogen oxidase
MSSERIAILGAGMAGFGAAHRFHEAGLSTTLYEQRSYHGGHTASHTYPQGFTFDEGPHISFTKDQRLQDLFADSVGGEFETLRTSVNNYWKGYWIKHPAQTNLHGLPIDLVVAIIKDFVAAREKPGGEIRNYADWLISTFG